MSLREIATFDIADNTIAGLEERAKMVAANSGFGDLRLIIELGTARPLMRQLDGSVNIWEARVTVYVDDLP